jgi:glutathione S-transferase
MTKPVLHEYSQSANCYKLRLVAAHLGIPLERREYDILKGETRTPGFLARVNANGRIPVLQIGDRFLPESNAACAYLAHGSRLIPTDRFDHADMLRWMFYEQYHVEPNIGTLRFWRVFLGDGLTDFQRLQLPAKQAGGEAALALMDEHLSARAWFVGETMTLADIVLYAYTHLGEQGGFALAGYPNVTAWLARVAAAPGHIGMND